MINLVQYREYWEGVGRRVDAITGVVAVTVDDGMARVIQRLPAGSVTLFFLPPAAESVAKSPDAFREENECVVFLMEKYDPQRKSPFAVLESTQPVIEAVKALMLGTMTRACSPARLDVGSLNTLPETKFFAGFAGWSIGFKLIT